MRYLFDTNVWIDLERGKNTGLVQRASVCSRAEVALSTIVLGELLGGAQRSADPVRAYRSIETLVTGIKPVGVDEEVALAYGHLRAHLEGQGLIIGPNDLWIAAQALRYELVLVTANEAEFNRVPSLVVENWR